MPVYAVLDATHYPIAIFRDLDKAKEHCAKVNAANGVPNAHGVGSLAYVVRSKLIDA